MSEPFLAEIKMVGFNFAPRSWSFCDGQILPINQNQSLYSLLGTTYGGDGRTSFALPDLRSRTPIHVGEGHALGQKAGAESVTLTDAQTPVHKHEVDASTVPPTGSGKRNPTDKYPTSGANLGPAGGLPYHNKTDGNLNAGSVLPVGGGQAHDNMQPYQTIAFCIALQGLFPSRN